MNEARAVQPGAGPGGAAATRALPRDISSFTGRAHELDRLAPGAAGAGGVIGIYAIDGRAGIGKTAFAVHAAHQLAASFPDGQVFLPLHGHTAGQRPVAPADALASLLLAAGVEARQIPAGLPARTQLWRDRLAGRRLLLVLDDAAGNEQVGPLLPGTESCLVLVTSRRRLTALDETAAVSLDVLPAGQAADLLVRMADRPGLDPGDPVVARIAALCGYLPLALGLLARQLHHRPAGRAADLAAELAAARSRAELTSAGDGSVAAALSLACRDLTAAQQRLLDRLGLYPGTDIDVWAAAALDDCDPATAGRSLAALCDRHLITEPACGRYRWHDLVRDYARARAAAEDPVEADAAVSRLLGYLEHTAATADAVLARHPRPDVAARYLPPAAAPALDSYDQALAWLRAGRADLLACIAHAAGHGLRARLVALTAGLSSLLRMDGPWAESLELCGAAVGAAHELGDQVAEAGARSDLAALRDRTGDYAGAAAELEHALRLYRGAGSQVGEAAALSELGVARYLTGDAPGALADLERSLELYLALGSRQGEAAALNELGNLRGWGGDLPAASRALARSLELCRELGDRHGEASARGRLGAMRIMAGDFADATTALEESLRLYRELASRGGEAATLSGLAMVRRMTGDYPAAIGAQQRALVLYRELGHQLGEAGSLYDLGICQRMQGDLPAAIRAHERSLEIFRDIGNLVGQSAALNELGVAHTLTGDYPAAALTLAEALEAARGAGRRAGEAEVLNNLGTLRLRTGDPSAALACHRSALDVARAVSSPLEEARALEGAGRCALSAGRAPAAAVGLRQALKIYQRIGAAEAAGLAADLASLTDPDRT
jgi:tetratricopeptide (TPR) repeat protein